MSLDELVSDLSSFSVSNEENCSQNRIGQYKAKGSRQDQESRRAAILERQKIARAQKTAVLRNITEEEEAGGEKKTNPFKHQLMLSEWLEQAPSDLLQNWVCKLAPAGHRTLIVAQKGRTSSYTKSGYRTATFASHLPGGSSYNKTSYTVLDGVWCEDVQCFYILDVLCYKAHPVLDSDTEFRFFWGKTKFEEDLVRIGEVTKKNKYPMYWLPHSPCDKESLVKLLSNPPLHFLLDGVLFYHKMCHYSAGSTPLVGWMKPNMLNSVLSLDIDLSKLCKDADEHDMQAS